MNHALKKMLSEKKIGFLLLILITNRKVETVDTKMYGS